MASLFENAVASIRMGVEDFRQQDADRDISAVRNFYAGVLLLAKEAIIRAAPLVSSELIIGAKTKPVSDGKGGMTLKQVGHTTIDFNQIAVRAKDFNVKLDHKALEELNTIRNDMEHHYTNAPSNSIRSALSKGFPVVASLFRQLGEDPVTLLGGTWATMLKTKELYDQELLEAKATLLKVDWYSPSIGNAQLRCVDCSSELIGQLDHENVHQRHVEFNCRTCGSEPDTDAIIVSTLNRIYRNEAYSRYKDAGESGPVYTCPACDKDALVEGEDGCANCSEPLDYEKECQRCGNGISIDEYLQGADEGYCSYCDYVHDKIMRED